MMFFRRAIGTAIVVSCLAGCAPSRESFVRLPNADPEQGRVEMKNYSCGVCHVIPGVRGARGQVGPTLESYAKRVYVAGKFQNEPQLLAQWIQDAPSLASETAMPAIDMSDEQARNMA